MQRNVSGWKMVGHLRRQLCFGWEVKQSQDLVAVNESRMIKEDGSTVKCAGVLSSLVHTVMISE
jgi:hypothetical protein